MPGLPKSTLTGIAVIVVGVLAGLGAVDPDAALAFVAAALGVPAVDSISREVRAQRVGRDDRRRR